MGVDVRSRELDRLSAVEDICARTSTDQCRVQLRFDSISHAVMQPPVRISSKHKSCLHYFFCEEKLGYIIRPMFYRSIIRGMDADLVRDDDLLYQSKDYFGWWFA